MNRKLSNIHVSIFVLLTTTLLLAFGAVRLVNAGRGIILRPPFNGVYRVTAYFDHQNPNYVAIPSPIFKKENLGPISCGSNMH